MRSKEKKFFDENELKSIAQDILELAKQSGASDAEVDIETNRGFSVSAAKGDVETVEYHQDKGADVRVFFGKSTGVASISDLSKEAIRNAVDAACYIAKFTDEDAASGLAEKDELAFHYPEIKLAEPWLITVEKAIELAIECEQLAYQYDKRIMIAEDCKVGTLEGFSLYANTRGFMGHYPSSHHEIACVLVAKDKDEMQRDYSYTMSSDPARLMPVADIAKEAAHRAISRLGARAIPTTKAPVIFYAEEARGLLGHLATAIQGSSIYRKSSFLLNKLGKKIFPEFVNIIEYPHLPMNYGSCPFDSDGVLTRNNVFIDQGVLQQYSMGVYSARKLGLKTTGNADGVHNLTITPSNKNFKALLKSMDKGLLITELMGQGVNLLTGDYSRGAAGFWIENGEIQFPVHEVTVAGNLNTMYENLVEVGNDVDMRGNVHTGSLLVAEMMIAGN